MIARFIIRALECMMICSLVYLVALPLIRKGQLGEIKYTKVINVKSGYTIIQAEHPNIAVNGQATIRYQKYASNYVNTIKVELKDRYSYYHYTIPCQQLFKHWFSRAKQYEGSHDALVLMPSYDNVKSVRVAVDMKLNWAYLILKSERETIRLNMVTEQQLLYPILLLALLHTVFKGTDQAHHQDLKKYVAVNLAIYFCYMLDKWSQDQVGNTLWHSLSLLRQSQIYSTCSLFVTWYIQQEYILIAISLWLSCQIIRKCIFPFEYYQSFEIYLFYQILTYYTFMVVLQRKIIDTTIGVRPETTLWSTLIIIVQTIILHLQESRGNRFFMPLKYRTRIYEQDIELKQIDGKDCSICLGHLSTAEPLKFEDQVNHLKASKVKLKITPCLHIFHIKCIDRWLRSGSICPNCKKPIRERKSYEFYILS